jgi:hypothetical protein
LNQILRRQTSRSHYDATTHEENNKNLPLMPDKYIWDKESGPEFQTTLASMPFQDKIKSIFFFMCKVYF